MFFFCESAVLKVKVTLLNQWWWESWACEIETLQQYDWILCSSDCADVLENAPDMLSLRMYATIV